MTAAVFSAFDAHMMDVALMMARRGNGTTAPNPSVGAVIADEATGELIARAVTRPGGRPHAETEAIARAGTRAQGATLYVTLEPCAHHGKTPPCADAVIAAGLKRVVIGIEDPDPRTAGQGTARLRAAGVDVATGLRGAEARWVTLGHILRVTEQRPFVQLKMALGQDGAVPRGKDGQAVFVTGPEARAFAHVLRAEADAILIGGATARDDDPDLTCRLPGLASRSPIRVVMTETLDVPMGLKLVRTAHTVPTWVLTGSADAGRVRALADQGVRVLTIGDGAARPSVRAALAELAGQGITRLLVEGGPSVWRAFAAAGLADEVVVFAAGAARDGGMNPAALAARYAPGLDLALTSERRAGADRLAMFRVRPAAVPRRAE